MGHCPLTLAFLRPPPDEDDIENRLTAALSWHGICHVELVFDGGVAFSIVQDGVAGLRHRTFSNPNYETVTLSASASEYQACLRFCRDAHARQLKFDRVGMYLSALHPGGCLHRDSLALGKTFCSKIITEALRHAGVAEAKGLEPSCTTPSSLYAAVRASQRRMCHSVRLGSLPLRIAPPNRMPG
jgi:hypothetical protein